MPIRPLLLLLALCWPLPGWGQSDHQKHLRSCVELADEKPYVCMPGRSIYALGPENAPARQVLLEEFRKRLRITVPLLIGPPTEIIRRALRTRARLRRDTFYGVVLDDGLVFVHVAWTEHGEPELRLSDNSCHDAWKNLVPGLCAPVQINGPGVVFSFGEGPEPDGWRSMMQDHGFELASGHSPRWRCVNAPHRLPEGLPRCRHEP